MKSIQKLAALLLCLCMVTPALADVLVLPSNVKVIEEEAFYDDTSLDEVVLPDGIEEIGPRAFAKSSVSSVNLPSSLTYIADDAFDANKDIAFEAEEGSYASEWVEEFKSQSQGQPSAVENFTFSDNGDGTCTVTGYTGATSADIVIPRENADGLLVTAIGSEAFSERSDLTGSLTIPDSVTKIEDDAFYNCSGLTGSLTIPDSVTTIGVRAFKNCYGFTGSLTIGNCVTTIGSSAFGDCYGFTGSLTIPDSVRTIEWYAFAGCYGFTGSLTIPDSVRTIGWYAFAGCYGFTGSLTIPDSVTTIGNFAFNGCYGFTGSLTISDSVTTIGRRAFNNCSGFTGSLTISNSLTKIEEYAFNNCSGFTGSLTIPDSVTTIEEYAFNNCSGFTGSLTIPDSVTTIEEYAFNNCSGFTGSLTIPDSATTIEEYAFNNCSGFTGSLTIPDNVTTIKEYAFNNCSGFNGSLTISDSVTTIEGNTFQNCSGFTGSLTIPDSVTAIGYNAFKGCSGFTGSLTIPDSVTSIGGFAFEGCSGFTGSLTIPDSVTSIDSSTFSGCSGFTGSLTIPDSVTNIGAFAFDGCSGFTGSLTIPDGVTTISFCAFDGCSGFTGSLTIPDGVTTISYCAFDGCSGFTGNLTIPDSVSTIDFCAFRGCSGFTGNLTIPNSVTKIGFSAFEGCSGFTGKLIIPDSVKSIDEDAFSDCNLEKVKVTHYDGTTTYEVAVYCPVDSYAWRWAAKQSGFVPVEWPTTDPTLTGSFTNRTMTIVLGDTSQIPAATVQSTGDPIHRVTLTINGWSQDESGNDRYRTHTFEGLNLHEISLTDPEWANDYILDTTQPPLNEPGEYTINLWASTSDANGSGVKLDSMTVYVVWTVYVLSSRVNTYATSTDPIPNGYVDQSEPVFVIREENGRYLIQMRLSAGGYALRWVDKEWIGTSEESGVPVTISGSVTNGTEPLQNVYVRVVCADTGELLGTTWTLPDGTWFLNGAKTGNNYTVYYLSDSYAFMPSYQTITPSIGHPTNLQTVASLNTDMVGSATVSAVANLTGNEIETGVPVIFTLTLQDADRVRLIVDDIIYESYMCSDNTGMVQRAFSKAGLRKVVFQAGNGNIWGGCSDPIMLNITSSLGTLSMPVPRAQSVSTPGKNVTVSWNAVPNAANYHVYIFSNICDTQDFVTDQTRITIPGSRLVNRGRYDVEVVAAAPGYTQCSGTTHFDVLDTELSIAADSWVHLLGETAQISIRAPGADYISYVATAPGSTEDMGNLVTIRSSEMTYSLDMNQEGSYQLHVWAGTDSSTKAYAEETVEIHAYHLLELASYSVSVSGNGDIAEVAVTADADWEIDSCSEWILAEKTATGLRITVTDGNLGEKTGYVQIACGATKARLAVHGTMDNTAVMITSPASAILGMGDLPVGWITAEGASSYDIYLVDIVEEKTVYSIVCESGTDSTVIPGGLLRSGHEYALWISANGSSINEGKAEFSVEGSDTSYLSGTVKDRYGAVIQGSVVIIEYDGHELAKTVTDENGQWAFDGLAVGYQYTITAAVSEDITSTPKDVMAVSGIQQVEDLICDIDVSEAAQFIIMEYDEGTICVILPASDPVSVSDDADWLSSDLTEINGYLELELTAEDFLIARSADTPNFRTAVATVNFADGSHLNYRIQQNKQQETISVSYDYLAPMYPRRATGEDVFDDNGHTAAIMCEIDSLVSVKGDAVIGKNHTLTVKGQNGVLTVSGNLTVEGKIVLENNLISLQVFGNLIVASGGEIEAKCAHIVANGNIRLDPGAEVSVNGGRLATTKNLYTAGKISLDNGSGMDAEDIRLDNKGSVQLTGGRITCNNLSVTDQSSLTMTGGNILVFYDLVFKTSSVSGKLSGGEISCGGNANLESGYIATGIDHKLSMTYDQGVWIFGRKKIYLKSDGTQKIGNLIVSNESRFSSIDVNASDCYSSNVKKLQNSTIIGQTALDAEALKNALSYDPGILKLWSVDGFSGGPKLSNGQKAAIVMAHLNFSAKYYQKSLLISSGLAENSGTVHFYYISGNTIYCDSFRYVENYTVTNGKNCIGTAHINYKNYDYTINCKDAEAMNKLMEPLMETLKADAKDLANSVFSFVLGAYGAVEVDSLIISCFELFELVGIVPENGTTTAEVLINEYNGVNQENRELIRNMINLINTYK